MIEYTDARARILAAAKGLPAGSVPLLQSLGRTLARDIRAAENIPPFTKATMDGYAVRAADTRQSGAAGAVELDVLEDLPAGRLSRKTVGPAQAVRIMPGAPLPAGADAVVMVEDTGKTGRRVTVRREVGPGANIGLAGEDLKKGDLALEQGALIGPAEIGMLAAAGRHRVPVTRRPRLAVIATGDEIVEPGERKRRGQIRNANGPALTALALAAGAEPVYLGIARDRNSSLAAKLSGAKDADILVLSGGVSVGDYDLVRAELEPAGIKTVFWQNYGEQGRREIIKVPQKHMVTAEAC